MTRTKKSTPGGGGGVANRPIYPGGARVPGVAMSRAHFKASADKSKKQPTFYAVLYGRDGFSGILNTWEECKRYVHGVSKAVFKGFKTLPEARAFLQRQQNSTTTTHTTAMSAANRPKTNPSSSASNHHANAYRQPPPRPYQYFSMQDAMNNNTPKHKGPKNRKHSTGSPASRQAALDTISVCKKEVSDKELFADVTAESIVKDSPDLDPESPNQLDVYTDGACSQNGRANARAGYGVFFEEESPYNISARLKDNPTNQRAEMTAVLEAIRVTIAHGLLAPNGTLIVNSDSKYTIDGINEWMGKWKKNGWRTAGGNPVSNKEVWEALSAGIEALALKGVRLELRWVKGHDNIFGNEMADALACAGRDAIH